MDWNILLCEERIRPVPTKATASASDFRSLRRIITGLLAALPLGVFRIRLRYFLWIRVTLSVPA